MEKIKLFCLPYAGGSATVYYKLKGDLNRDIELRPVELAGRGKRIRKPLYTNLEEAVDDIYGLIRDELDDGPYAILGHSLGSVLTYELLYAIEQSGHSMPVHAFFSGSRPPHMLDRSKILHTLPDAEFQEEILAMGGTDRKVFENEELSSYFLRVLKADFKIVEDYRYTEKSEKLKTDITVLTGKSDSMTYEEMLGWRGLTEGTFHIYEFDGNHFFINSCTKEIAAIVNRTLATRPTVMKAVKK